MKIIDPHVHLFDLEKGDYQWLKASNPPFWPDKKRIHQNFTENDLSLSSPFELAGFVHIEAGFNNNQPWQELEWLELHCKKPFKSVASIDLTLSSQAFTQVLDKLLACQSFVGCRHILDDDFEAVLTHPNILDNFALLAKHNLSFDLQMPIGNPEAVALFTNVLNKVADLTVIINHAGWPSFSSNIKEQSTIKGQSTWQQGLQTLSQFKQCSIKCSGWEMEKRDYAIDEALFIIEQCIQAFGFDRVLLASNFPLCLFSKTYQKFWAEQLTTLDLVAEKLESLCSANAKRIYKF